MSRYLDKLQILENQRIFMNRFTKGASWSRSRCPFICSSALLQRRFYYNQSMGYPPPPPPGSTGSNMQGYHAAFPHDPPLHYRAPLHFSSELGTKERPIVVEQVPQKSSWVSRLWMILVLGVVANYFINLYEEFSDSFQENSALPRSGGGVRGGFAHMFGSAEIKPVNLDDLETTFESIRGCDEAKKELEDIVEFLKSPEKFYRLGGRLPKGALLVGPPGCGKTLLAKAIAKEAGVNFFYVTGSEFDEMFVGVGSRRVRDLFAAAKANAPALIFIDEIDALGGKRSHSDHSYTRMTLNQLLAEMDGFKTNESVIVIAATNTPDSLDKALTRPGRLDTTISVDPPDMKGRAEVLQIYLDKIKTDASVKAMEIARATTGFTGAELSNLVNIAAIRAAVLNKSEVSNAEIEYAKDRIMMGTESKKIIPEEERRVTAFHEGGHALVAMLLKDEGAEPIHKATIVPRGNGIMGLVQQLPEKDKYSQSKKQCMSRLKVCVAGRVGEEMLLGQDDVTTGAGSDFRQATDLARKMVRNFGFSTNLGFVNYGAVDTPEGAYMSDQTKRKIEEEVHALVTEAYLETKKLIGAHYKELEAIASNLLKYETLTSEDLKKILKGEPIPERTTKVTPPASSPPKSINEARKAKQRTVEIY